MNFQLAVAFFSALDLKEIWFFLFALLQCESDEGSIFECKKKLSEGEGDVTTTVEK